MIKKLGHSVIEKIKDLHYVVGYIGKLILASFLFVSRGKASRKILIMQLLFTYVEALPICSFLAVAIGTSVVFLGTTFLASLGQAKLTYDLLVLIVVRELGPLLIAFVVTARSATAIATEISSMIVGHEIEAYIASGVDPIGHLAAPRFIAVTLSLFFLTIYFSIFGLIAPAIVVQFISTTEFSEYFNALFMALTVKDVIIAIIKSLIFGMIISGSATYYGFKAGHASTEIPLAGLHAVGKAFSFCIIADVLISVMYYVF